MNQVTEPSYWEQRYQDRNTRWDLGEAAPPFASLLESTLLQPGKTAVIGCGKGHDALLFARYRFEVIGFDFAPSAIAAATSLSEQLQLPTKFLQRDIFDLAAEFPYSFDYVVEHTCFCAIAPDRRSRYVELVHSILKPQAELIALFWAHDLPGGPPFSTNLAEIDQLFSPRFKLSSIERPVNSAIARQGQEYLARFVAL